MAQQVPDSLYDLIEHVELNRSGWWDVALSNVLLAAIWLHGEPVRHEDVKALVGSSFKLSIQSDRIAGCIEWLLGEGKLLVQGGDHVTLSSDIADQMQERLKAAKLNQEAVSATFVERVASHCAPHSPEHAWTLFNQRYLLPLINVLGARTLQFMGSNQGGASHVAALTDEFVGLFEDSRRLELRAAIAAFLDPDDENVRRYVTEHLDASFLVRASGLTKEAIAEISSFGSESPTFHLFLDTNFLFSLLDLHENPSNESAQMLGRTIQQVGKHLTIGMHVIQPTIEEIKRTLQASQADLKGIQMPHVLADAALEVGFSGIAMRFFRVNSEAKQSISPQDYFGPYLNNLTPILRSKGIEVNHEQTSDYKERQDVIDDLHELRGVDGRTEGRRQRRYNAALHDSILWHFANDRRPEAFESPLEAVFWVVTNDYRLINFDKRRRRYANSAADVCIHPAELVQILRLWEPRGTDMEQALLSGLRLPFMFYDFDPGQEDASMRILRALSRFEHIGDLEPEAIRDIVLSDAVRSNTESASSEEEEIEVIRDALLAERSEIADQLDAAVGRADLSEKALAREREGIRDLAHAEREQQERASRRISELEAELSDAGGETRAMSKRVEALGAMLSERDEQMEVRSARIQATLTRGLAVGFLTGAVAAGLGFGWARLGDTPPLYVSLSVLVSWLGVWLHFSTTGIDDPNVRQWGPVRRLLDVWSVGQWVYLLVIIPVAVSAIWQEIVQPRWFP